MTSHKKDFVLQQIQSTEPKPMFGSVASYEPNMGDILNHLMVHRVNSETDSLATDEIIDAIHIEPIPVHEHIHPDETANCIKTEQITSSAPIQQRAMQSRQKTHQFISGSFSGEKHLDLPFLFSLNSHEFITAAYSVILNRAPDKTGQNYYQQRLRDGISRTQILGQLAASGETKEAKRWYKKFRYSYLCLKWRRLPIIGWACEFIAAFTQDHLRELLVHNDGQFVANAFYSILGRAPDNRGLEHYLTLLRAGKNKMTILVDIKLSEEGKAAGNRIAGLTATSWFYQLRNLPVFKWLINVLMLPQVVTENLQRTRHIELLIQRNQIQQQSTKRSVIVLGAGGHAKVIIEILQATGYEVSYCIGGADSPEQCMGVPVLQGDNHLSELRQSGYSLLFPAIGSNVIRERAAAHAVSIGYELINAISPHAIISPSVVLGKGIAIMSGAVINAQSTLEDPEQCMGVPVLQGDNHLSELRQSGYSLLFPAIGSNVIRERAAAHAVSIGYELINAISPHAIISPSVVLGKGIAIMSGAVINAQSTLEDLVIINTGATVDHDCRIGFCAHVAPQCALAGNVTIGSGTLVGIGTSIIPAITIGNKSIVGAGSVVISDIPSSLTALGNPAKIVYKDQKI